MPVFQVVTIFIASAGYLLAAPHISDKPVFQSSEKEIYERYTQNRKTLLARVRDFWVKGVLEQSLHEVARIELGMEERRDAVAERPWDVILRTSDKTECVLPPGTKISDVFENVGRSLLILGDPGAGKTTSLLELAKDMIDQAEKDPSEKIPMVFNLSSWTDPTQTFADWLVGELRDNYRPMPKEIASALIENDSLMLLLDGLDEVAQERREGCVDAINCYLEEREKNQLVQVAVCCRKKDYEDLNTKLKLQSAILLQPLTPEQIDDYLKRLSPDLDYLREALGRDQELQEFAKTPLILSIMTFAYRGISDEELQSLHSTEDRSKHLFKTYVDRMFERTGRANPRLYTKEDTIHWLSWLARKMSDHNQTVFLIEQMQPNWLETKNQQQLYSILVKLVFGLYGLVLALAFGLLIGQVFGLRVGLGSFLWLGLIFGLPKILISGGSNIEIEFITKSVNISLKALLYGLVLGVACGLIFCKFLLELGFNSRINCFLFIVLLIEVLNVSDYSHGYPSRKLDRGLSLSNTKIDVGYVPYQFIKQYAKNALLIDLKFSLLVGLLFYLLLVHKISLALLIGLIFLFYVMSDSFGSIIRHFTLMFVLCHENHLPRKVVPFLDYATDQIFLHKVGGGYVFTHKRLMEYFATLLEPIPNER